MCCRYFVEPEVAIRRYRDRFEPASSIPKYREFRPARKAHAALLIQDLPSLIERLKARSYAVRDDEPMQGFHRVYVDDPFGNRIELMEPLSI
jgi:hypothetical protein